MKNSYSQNGFGAVAAIIILAIVVIIGLVMYGNKDNGTDSDTDTATTTVDVTDTTATSTVSDSGTGELKNLFALKGEVVCTFSTKDSTSESSGTIYVSEPMYRGDFTVKQGTAAAIESHMIKQGEVIYTWSGNQGAKMSADAMMQSKPTGQGSDVSFDQDVDYDCKSWTKDESKFTLPTSVNFVDVSAMMKATVN